jgi:chromosomal replication initiation ATPase DnaA
MRDEDVKFLVSSIVAITSSVTGVSVQALLSPIRLHRVVLARWAVMQIASYRYGLTLNQIGRHLGRRHHTTVLHGLREAKKLPEEFAKLVLEIDEKLTSVRETNRVTA